MRHVVMIGVSGSGKTAVGARLAETLGYDFADADDFHPASSIEKMARGIPLTDADRRPWLEALSRWLQAQEGAARSTVLACSALRRRHRDVLRDALPDVVFVHLVAPADLLASRLRRRRHFLPPTLLGSQLETLEPLEADENGIAIDASRPLDEVVADCASRVLSAGGGAGRDR